MRNWDWKNIIITILIGAIVAGLSSFFDFLANALHGLGNEAAGSGVSMLWYNLRKFL